MSGDESHVKSHADDTSLTHTAVSPQVLCPNSTDGNIGNGEGVDEDNMEEGNIELPGGPTIPHTPTVEEYIKHKICV